MVMAVDDSIVEDSETFTFMLSSTDRVDIAAPAILTVEDNDSGCTLSSAHCFSPPLTLSCP